MIAKLRRRHRRMIAGLAVIAPLCLVASLAARTPPAQSPSLPPTLLRAVEQDVPSGALSVFDSALLWSGLSLRTRLLVDGSQRFVELTPHQPVRAPDVLLYASSAPPAGDALPSDARLLGRFAGSRRQAFALGTSQPASLWLFSLARGEVIGRADLAETRR